MAEYETLIDDPEINEPGRGVRRMTPQTLGHLIIILFVIVGNTAYLVCRKPWKKVTDESARG